MKKNNAFEKDFNTIAAVTSEHDSQNSFEVLDLSSNNQSSLINKSNNSKNSFNSKIINNSNNSNYSNEPNFNSFELYNSDYTSSSKVLNNSYSKYSRYSKGSQDIIKEKDKKIKELEKKLKTYENKNSFKQIYEAPLINLKNIQDQKCNKDEKCPTRESEKIKQSNKMVILYAKKDHKGSNPTYFNGSNKHKPLGKLEKRSRSNSMKPNENSTFKFSSTLDNK